MNNSTHLVENNYNYKSLLCYKKAENIYDLTFHFLERFIDKYDRTHDQMLQAARSVKQNIIEGSIDIATSFEMSLKLLNIARGSLHELLADYEDYLRTRKLRHWATNSCENVAMQNLGKANHESQYYVSLAESRSDEVVANMIIVLIRQEDVLLRGYIEMKSKQFLQEGGFREKLSTERHKVRGDFKK